MIAQQNLLTKAHKNQREKGGLVFTNDRIRNALSTITTFPDMFNGTPVVELKENQPEGSIKVIGVCDGA